MLISLFFTALFDRAVTVAYEDYYGWDFVAHDQSSADVEVIKRDFIALSASA